MKLRPFLLSLCFIFILYYSKNLISRLCWRTIVNSIDQNCSTCPMKYLRCTYSFKWFIRSFVHSYFCSFVHSFIRSFVLLFISHSSIHLFINSFICSFKFGFLFVCFFFVFFFVCLFAKLIPALVWLSLHWSALVYLHCFWSL